VKDEVGSLCVAVGCTGGAADTGTRRAGERGTDGPDLERSEGPGEWWTGGAMVRETPTPVAWLWGVDPAVDMGGGAAGEGIPPRVPIRDGVDATWG
jgi:hypothetical protein